MGWLGRLVFSSQMRGLRQKRVQLVITTRVAHHQLIMSSSVRCSFASSCANKWTKRVTSRIQRRIRAHGRFRTWKESIYARDQRKTCASHITFPLKCGMYGHF
eukprot:4637758-Pleurochrysis_carterae.AAC.2